MSTKKAAYHGASGTGVDVVVTFDDESVSTVHVPHGNQLPTEVDGKPVPARVRDSLLAQDGWSEVKVGDIPKKEKE